MFTKDAARGRRVASQVETGMGIQEFVNKKLVRTHDMAAPLV